MGFITSGGVGFLTGLFVVGLFVPSFNRRLHTQYRTRLAQMEAALQDLRQERADDRETNRQLRRQLAINTPKNLESTRQERDWALEELEKLSDELSTATTELADRDRSLREARLAIHDIRVHLERNRSESDQSGIGEEVLGGELWGGGHMGETAAS